MAEMLDFGGWTLNSCLDPAQMLPIKVEEKARYKIIFPNGIYDIEFLLDAV